MTLDEKIIACARADGYDGKGTKVTRPQYSGGGDMGEWQQYENSKLFLKQEEKNKPNEHRNCRKGNRSPVCCNVGIGRIGLRVSDSGPTETLERKSVTNLFQNDKNQWEKRNP